MGKLVRSCSLLGLFAAASLAPFHLFFTQKLSFYTYHALSGLIALKYQMAQCIVKGEFPLWNPFLFGGIPFHTGIGILDPFLAPFLYFRGPAGAVTAMVLSGMLAFLTAGLAMYLYLRQSWNLSRVSALLGGILYLANPFFGATCHEMPFMAPAVYLPLVFLFADRSFNKRSLFNAILCGFFLSLSLFSGNLESFYLILLFFVLVFGVQMLTEFIFTGQKAVFFKNLIFPVVAIAAAFCFSAVEWIPSFEMMADSARLKDGRAFQNLINFFNIGATILLISLFARKWRHQSDGFKRFVRSLVLFSLLLLFGFSVNWKQGFAEIFPNVFFPNVKMVMINGMDAFDLILNQTHLDTSLIRRFVEPRFIFYLQPPIFIFTLSTLVLFVWAFVYTDSIKLKAFGGIAILLILFPYTFTPNLNAILFHWEALNYPRIMFGFFFIQTILIVNGFEMMRDRNRTAPSFFILKIFMGICFAGLFLMGMLASFFPVEQLSSLIQKFSNQASTAGFAGFLELSKTHLELSLTVLAFFMKMSRLLSALAFAKYVSLVFLLLLLLSQRKIWKYLFVLSLSLEVLFPWSLYVFQKPDIRSLITPYIEKEFLNKMDPNERMGTFHDSELTVFNFYNRDSSLIDLSANMPLFWDAKTVEQSAINLLPSRGRNFWLLEKGNTSFAPIYLDAIPSLIYDLMGMKYLFSEKVIDQSQYIPVARGDRYRIYENTHALPRFYFAKELREADEKSITNQIQNRTWDPVQATYIETAVPVEYYLKPDEKRSINVVKNKYNEIQLDVKTQSPVYFATTEAFHKNWKVFVDGVEKPLIRTNLYFRGLFLERGSHNIRFIYQSRAFILGVSVTLISLLLTACVFFHERRSQINKINFTTNV